MACDGTTKNRDAAQPGVAIVNGDRELPAHRCTEVPVVRAYVRSRCAQRDRDDVESLVRLEPRCGRSMHLAAGEEVDDGAHYGGHNAVSAERVPRSIGEFDDAPVAA